MDEIDSFIEFKSALATDLGVELPSITDSVARVVLDDHLLLHHIMTCKSDPFMRSLLLRDLQSKATTYPQHNSAVLLRKAAAAAITWLASGAKFVSDAVYKSRITACNACEHRQPAPNTKLYKLLQTKFICELCGCDIFKKARLLTEACPDAAISNKRRWP